MDEPQSPPTTTSNIWKWVLIIIAIVAIIIIIILIALYAGGTLGSPTARERTTVWPGYGANLQANGERFTFENVQKLKRKELKSGSIKQVKDTCKTYKKRLPAPRTQFDVNQILDTIKQYHEDAECETYALGVWLNPELRYESLDGKQKWPSVINGARGTGKNPGIPEAGVARDCVLLAITPPNVEQTHQKCADVKSFTCILIQECTAQSVCTLTPKTVSATSMLDAWKAAGPPAPPPPPPPADKPPEEAPPPPPPPAAKPATPAPADAATATPEPEAGGPAGRSSKPAANIALVDKNYIPDELKQASTTNCYAYAVKYVFDYVDIYGNSRSWKINTKTVQHPELQCVSVNGTSLEPIRVSCENVGCPICF